MLPFHLTEDATADLAAAAIAYLSERSPILILAVRLGARDAASIIPNRKGRL